MVLSKSVQNAFSNNCSAYACGCAKSLLLCLTLCNPMNCSPPGSSVHGFSRQEYWSGLPCPPPGDLPDPGIKPAFLLSPALAGRFFTTSASFPGWPSKSCLAPLYLMVLIIVHSQDDSIISMRKSILGPTQWGQFIPSSLLSAFSSFWFCCFVASEAASNSEFSRVLGVSEGALSHQTGLW